MSAALDNLSVNLLQVQCCKSMKVLEEPDPPPLKFPKEVSSLPQDIFVPLTITQLYYIKTYPMLVSFGRVCCFPSSRKYCLFLYLLILFTCALVKLGCRYNQKVSRSLFPYQQHI